MRLFLFVLLNLIYLTGYASQCPNWALTQAQREITTLQKQIDQ